jgi:hypothetical protein
MNSKRGSAAGSTDAPAAPGGAASGVGEAGFLRERVEAEAARYRYLRDYCVVEWHSDMARDKGAPSLSIDFEADGHDLDAAIDAAIGGAV